MSSIHKVIVTAFLIVISTLSAYSQLVFTVYGVVMDENGEVLPSALVQIDSSYFTTSDLNGGFSFSEITAGEHTLKVSYLGYSKFRTSINISKKNSKQIKVVLKESAIQINSVEIRSNSKEEMTREKGYAVDVMTTKEVQNITSDINQVIRSTPGINIRESGGLGSGFTLSLNGLSGNQIRYFIDGIPMENFGSALSLNNFPVNQIEKIEVYKGVVPIALGADALGGAINIISGLKNKSFVDASYSYGSFNTHRASVTAQLVNSKKGLFIKLNSFYNHSDNNYLMKDVPVYDLELGNRINTIDIERFNDEYSSTMFAIEGGVVNKKYADELSVKVTQANNTNYYQHPNNNILRPFGNFHNQSSTTIISSTYKKSYKKFTAKAFLSVGQISSQVIDTSTFKYNWAGDYIQREANDPKGELFARRSLFELKDKVLRNQLQLQYALNNLSVFDFSWSQSYLHREGKDEVDLLNQSFSVPNSIAKNILAFSYTFTNKSENIEFISFVKEYIYTGSITVFNSEDEEQTTKPTLNNRGYGAALSYKPVNNITLKASYEKAYRYPEGFEILGDGIYVNPNPSLSPEMSHNYNLGARANQTYKKVRFTEEVKLFYRNSGDFIRFNPIGPFGSYENLANVNTTGVEADVAINFNERLSVKANGTFQNLTDQTKEDEGFENDNYQSRLPNIPYLFGNLRVGINLLKSQFDKKLSFHWSVYFVEDFFLTWENSGNLEDKNTIPSQILHGVDVEYSIKEGKYNASLSVNNLMDELVYDNFNIQKPGRAIYLKLRYFISKSNN